MTATIQNSNFTTSSPFVKWVGGKRGLLPQITQHAPKEFNNYFEPFVGGGALFFDLFSKGRLQNKKVYLFDINSELINAYQVVKEYPTQLVNQLLKMREQHNKDFYYEVRGLDRKKDFLKIDHILRAARFIYLNKTCFNGLYRVNKKNQNNVPMGSYKNPNICDEQAIYNASEALQCATIINTSYKNTAIYAEKNDFVYFDPPYYPLNKTANFTSYTEFDFLEKEQKELFTLFKELNEKKCLVLQSNSDTDFVNDLYKDFRIEKIQASRFINSKSNERGKISEVLIMNSNVGKNF